jgi:beta-phosphoglucomutase-like phosphatase (HAD superfamily)
MAADPKLMYPTPGLLDLLQSAKNANVRMHAVTNAPHENAVFMMDALKLNDYFEGVVLGERCARPKPFPDPYLEGLSRVGSLFD